MAKRHEPSTAAQATAVACAAVSVLVGLALLLRSTAIYLTDFRNASDLLAIGALLAVIGLVGYLIYRNALRVLVRLPLGRHTPRAPQIAVPTHLVTACLADADFACPACSYNLRGLRHPACPECNEPVRFSLIESNTRPAAVGYWLAMVWLLTTMLCAGLIAVGWGVALMRMYSMMSTMGGASMGWLYITYVAHVVVGTAAVCACLVRLALLLRGRNERRPGGGDGWSRGTLITLIITNVSFMVLGGVTAMVILLYQ